MKKKTYQINIPEPCNEDWNKMTSQEQGRFCGKCEKMVIDFSNQSDQMIAQILKENSKICGRIHSSQLERNLVLEPETYRNTRWKAFGLMLSGLLAAGTLSGQDTTISSSTIEVTNLRAFDKNEAINQNNIVISGRVFAEGSKKILVGATIILQGSTIGCSTDSTGAFQLKISTEKSDLIKDELILQISYLGYQKKQVSIKKDTLQNNLNIDLREIYLQNSTIEIPEVDIRSYEFGLVDYKVGGIVHSTSEVNSKSLQSSRKDQTLYQLIKKKIRERKARKTKDE